MMFEYGGRFARIEVVGGESVRGFFVFQVDIDEVAADGSEVIGIEDSRKESVPLAALRARAGANGSTVGQEAGVVKADALLRAQQAFMDAVDAESF